MKRSFFCVYLRGGEILTGNRLLVLLGSPRSKGNTAALLSCFLSSYPGEYRIVDAYSSQIKACIDCRYCWKNSGCSLRDDMDLVYEELLRCNQLLIATPIYFAQPTAPLMTVFSRLQTYFASNRFRQEESQLPYKKAGVLLTGGGSGGKRATLRTIDMVLEHINAFRVGEASSLKTDHLLASQDKTAFEQIDHLLQQMLSPYFMESDRLGFSTWKPEDFSKAMELWGNSQVTKWIHRKGVMSLQEIQDRFEMEQQNQRDHHVQYWPVYLKANHEFIGCCGLRPYPSSQGTLEIGAHFLPSAWGHGYAKEASEQVMEYCRRRRLAKSLFAGHHPQNTNSGKVLEKLGFTYTGDEYYPPTGLMHPSYLFRWEKED